MYWKVTLRDLLALGVDRCAFIGITTAKTQRVAPFAKVDKGIGIVPRFGREEAEVVSQVLDALVFDIHRNGAECWDDVECRFAHHIDARVPHIIDHISAR